MAQEKRANYRKKVFALSITLMLTSLIFMELLFMTIVPPTSPPPASEPIAAPQGWGETPVLIRDSTDLDYQGAFTFTNDLVGSRPNGWTYAPGSLQGATIVDALGGHHKVLHISDTSSSGAVELKQTFSSGQRWGTVEWWYYGDSTSATSDFQLLVGGADRAVILIFKTQPAGKLWFQDDVGSLEICDLANDQWHHFRLSFNAYPNSIHKYTFSLWVDNLRRENPRIAAGEDLYHKCYFDFYTEQTPLTYLTLKSGESSNAVNMYFDAFDFSWAPGYFPNRTQNAFTFTVSDSDILYGTDPITLTTSLQKAVFNTYLNKWEPKPVTSIPNFLSVAIQFFVDLDMNGVYTAGRDLPIAKQATDSQGIATYTDSTIVRSLGICTYNISAEAIFTYHYAYNFEDAVDPTTGWHWWKGEDNNWNGNEPNPSMGGDKVVTTEDKWQGSKSLKIWTEPLTGLTNGMCGGYFTIDKCNREFTVDVYMKFIPSSLLSDKGGDCAAVWCGETASHIPGEPPASSPGGISMERFGGNKWCVGGEPIIPYETWDANCWYHVIMKADFLTQIGSWEIYSPTGLVHSGSKAINTDWFKGFLGSVQFSTQGRGGADPATDNTVFFDAITIDTVGILNLTTKVKMTYTTAGMPGYYPATFGFENDAHGAKPEGWSCWEGPGTMVTVVDDASWSHRKVLGLYDNNGGNYAATWQIFDLKTTGSVEFWVMTTNSLLATGMVLMGTGNLDVQLAIINGFLAYWDGIMWKLASIGGWCPINSWQWYRIRIDFVLNYPNYPTYLFFAVYVDDVLKINAYNTGDPGQSITCLWLSTGQHLFSNYWSYFDAVGYSWEGNYALGDNKNPGLLLDFEPDLNDGVTGMEYKVDSGSVYPTLGDRVIKMPSTGDHTVYVGPDILGGDPTKVDITMTTKFHVT